MGRILRIAAILFAVLVIAVLGVLFFLDANQFRPLLEEKLSSALGRQVKLGGLTVAVFSGGVTANDISIAEDPAFGKTPFLHAKALKVGVELWPLIASRRLNVTGVTLDQPEIDLIQTASGTWNYSTVGTKSAKPSASPAADASSKSSLDLTVKFVKITKGRLTITHLGRKSKPQVFDAVEIDVKDFSQSSAFPFSMTASVPGGGALQLDGTLGPLNDADTAETPAQVNLHLTHLDLAKSGFLEPSAGIAGVAAIDGSATSDGKRTNLKGHLKADQLQIAREGTPAKRPVELDFVLTHDLRKETGQLSKGEIHIGAAVANLTGSYELQPEASVSLKLSGPAMELKELAGILPAVNVVLPAGATIETGTALIDVATQGPLDRLTTTGTLGVDNARLANYDLASKMKTLELLAGIKATPKTEIQTLRATLKNTAEGTTLDKITLVVPAIGQMTGAGTILPNHAMDFRMQATLSSTSAVMTRLGQSDTTIPFLVQGTVDNPSFKPDVKGLATSQVKKLVGGEAGKAATGLLQGLFGKKN